MKVWVVEFTERPREVWSESTEVEEILHYDLGNGFIKKDNLHINRDPDGNPRWFMVEGWVHGELMDVLQGP